MSILTAERLEEIRKAFSHMAWGPTAELIAHVAHQDGRIVELERERDEAVKALKALQSAARRKNDFSEDYEEADTLATFTLATIEEPKP